MVCSVLGLSALALADETSLNPRALGVTEGVVKYCESVDPANAAKVRQVLKALAQGASEQQLAEVRQSEEYRTGYESVAEFTAKIDPHNATKYCADAVAGAK